MRIDPVVKAWLGRYSHRNIEPRNQPNPDVVPTEDQKSKQQRGGVGRRRRGGAPFDYIFEGLPSHITSQFKIPNSVTDERICSFENIFQMSRLPTLDHLVILVSHDTLMDLSDHIQHLFIVAPGGNHADGLTSNKLVLLEDGVYIEFIAFFDDIDPDRRSKHRWGNLKENTIIDWAFTLPPDDDFGPIKQRIENIKTRFSYEEPASGGRKKNDGAILEWTVSVPTDALTNALPPGRLPFWCLDKTPRELRVPYAVEPHLTQHPSGVRGVSSLSLSVPMREISDLTEVYGAIHGHCDSVDLVNRGWPYEVPSGSTAGRHGIMLLGSAGETNITLTLSGLSPGRIELLPGLAINIE